MFLRPFSSRASFLALTPAGFLVWCVCCNPRIAGEDSAAEAHDAMEYEAQISSSKEGSRKATSSSVLKTPKGAAERTPKVILRHVHACPAACPVGGRAHRSCWVWSMSLCIHQDGHVACACATSTIREQPGTDEYPFRQQLESVVLTLRHVVVRAFAHRARAGLCTQSSSWGQAGKR